MHKCGAAYAKEIREWFDPRDPVHIIAFFQYERTGRWPENFLGDVWFMENGWQEELRTRIAEAPLPAKVKEYMDELGWIQLVVDSCAFPGYKFIVEPFADHFTIHVRYNEPDVQSNIMEEQNGRKWLLPRGQTTGQVVQTCFKAIMTSMEHRAREHFTYRGKAILQPHLDVDKLWENMP